MSFLANYSSEITYSIGVYIRNIDKQNGSALNQALQ